MPNAADADTAGTEKLLIVGDTGSGKTSQIWTLPGKKFAYIFDPNALRSLRGLDLDYEMFLPDVGEQDFTLKGFNRNSRSDKPKRPKEPTTYIQWEEHFNNAYEKGALEQYQWIIFDSLTFFSAAIMARNLWLNNRYGDIEELSDYRVVGNSVSQIFLAVTSLQKNIYCTGHLSSFQDEKTNRIMTQLYLPGSARNKLPLLFTNIWLASVAEKEGKVRYTIRTAPEARGIGLKSIRSTVRGLDVEEDVTIDWSRDPTGQGIGALLSGKRNQQGGQTQQRRR